MVIKRFFVHYNLIEHLVSYFDKRYSTETFVHFTIGALNFLNKKIYIDKLATYY